MQGMRRTCSLILIAALGLGGAACSEPGAPVPVPTPIAKPMTTETVTGTILQLGNFNYQFKVVTNSEVHVTLTSVSTVAVTANPDADPPVVGKASVPVAYPLTITVGQASISVLGLGCTNLKQTTTPPGTTPQLTGQALSGNFCVEISDAKGTLPEAVNFTLTVAHS